MAIEALVDAQLFVNQFNLTGLSSEVQIGREAEALDRTTFASAGNREYGAGLRSATFDLRGFLDFADDGSNEIGEAAFGATNTVSVAVDDAHGSVALLAQLLGTKFPRVWKVGEDPLWSMAMQGSTPAGVVAGRLIVPKTTVTAGGSGTGYQVGAVASGQKIYAAVHVLACTGTLGMTLVSDDNSGFTSATTRHTFTSATGATSEWASVAGAITDTYWRVNYSLPSGSATFAVTVGIV